MQESQQDMALWDALEVDSYNGFAGFQASRHEKCIYIGQPFLDKPRIVYGSFPSHEINEDEFLLDLRAHLPADVAKEDVWLTDYLGRNFLTVKPKDYQRIPEIINACLASGTYRFLTHNGTPWKAIYQPGEQFTRVNWEQKLIHSMRDAKTDMEKYHNTETSVRILFGHGMRTYTKHWNYATEEGRAFCSELRGWLRKRKPVSTFNDRFNWPHFTSQMEKHQMSYAGGWSKYQPLMLPSPIVEKQVEPPQKKASPERNPDGEASPERNPDGEEACIGCLDRKPSTLVLPCMHTVVCDECSKKLENTPDKNICIQCRCAITSVFYSDGNETTKKEIKTGE